MTFLYFFTSIPSGKGWRWINNRKKDRESRSASFLFENHAKVNFKFLWQFLPIRLHFVRVWTVYVYTFEQTVDAATVRLKAEWKTIKINFDNHPIKFKSLSPETLEIMAILARKSVIHVLYFVLIFFYAYTYTSLSSAEVPLEKSNQEN